jgi:hypothetical protein
VDGRPDLDPVVRMTHILSPNLTFARHRIPPVLYGQAPVPLTSNGGALFLEDAFWGLPLASGPGAALRGYWARRVLEEMLPAPLAGISYHSSYGRRHVDTASEPSEQQLPRDTARVQGGRHNATKPANRGQLFAKSMALSARISDIVYEMEILLREWVAPASSAAETVREIAVSLAEAMTASKLWDKQHVELVRAFYEDLNSLGYKFPRRGVRERPARTTRAPTTPVFTTTNPNVTDLNETLPPRPVEALLVRLTVSDAMTPAIHKAFEHSLDLATSDPDSTATEKYVTDSTRWWDVRERSATVAMLWRDVIVQTAIYDYDFLPRGSFDVSPAPVRPPCESVPLYQQWKRPKVLFVVNAHWNREVDRNANLSHSSDPRTTQQILLDSVFQWYYNTPFDVVFVGPGETRHGFLGRRGEEFEGGYNSWLSVTVAAERYPGYEGYFLVNDDMVLVQANLNRRLFHWRWQYPFSMGNHRVACRPGFAWAFNDYCFNTMAAFKEICGDQFRGDCGGLEGLYFGQSDGFYVPAPMIHEWNRWSDAMLRQGVFLELAVPTMLNALAPTLPCTPPPVYSYLDGRQSALSLSLCTSWSAARDSYQDHMIAGLEGNKAHCTAYHPIKIASGPKIAAAVEAHLRKLAETDCKEAPCHGSFSLDPDGLLWHWNDA